MNLETLSKIIVSPRMTEKATNVADQHNQVVFKVASSATKLQVKHAVEKFFNVVVEKVNTLHVKPKRRRFAQREGVRSGWKKAYVSLKEGYEINFIDTQK